MLFLVEIDHVRSGTVLTPDAARTFVEQVIFPTLERARQLLAEKKIVAGGPAVGRVALRLLVEAESPAQADQVVTSLPLWPLAEPRVTPHSASGDIP
jgi:hypothetical protein